MKLDLYRLLADSFITRTGALGKKIDVSLVYLLSQETLQEICDKISHEFPSRTEVDKDAVMVKVRGQWIDVKDYIEDSDNGNGNPDGRADRHLQSVL